MLVPVLCSLVGLLISNALQMCPDWIYMYSTVHVHTRAQTRSSTAADAVCNIKGNHERGMKVAAGRAEGGVERLERHA